MMKKLVFAMLMSCPLLCSAQDFDNCFAIIVGREASADGSVILAHNEDDADEQMFNAYITQGRTIKSEKQYGTMAAGYFWAEFPGMPTADAYMNEFGVAVVSDNCKSREDKGELTDGGVLYEVRQNVARYAHSAREAVTIIGYLVSTYGYCEPGRTYIVADTSEAWLVSVVKGKHWAAARVPDNGVVVIPNYYVLDKVDLSDKANYDGSEDIVSYAVERGWYDPAKDGGFSFKKAYADLVSRSKPFNVERHKDAFKALGRPYDDPFNNPFSYTPEKKLSLEDVMGLLSLHREKYVTGSITRNTTVLSTIFQMRAQMPKQIGCICWLAMGHPDVEPYFPVYLGMTRMPRSLSRYDSWQKAEKRHFTHCRDMRKDSPRHSWWRHLDRWQKIYANPEEYGFGAASKAALLQGEIFEAQERFEKEVSAYDDFRLPVKLNRNFEEWYEKWLFNFELEVK